MNKPSDTKLRTTKNMSKSQYTNMGQMSFITKEKSDLSFEKALSTGTLRSSSKVESKKENAKNKSSKQALTTRDKATNPIIDQTINTEKLITSVTKAKNQIIKELSDTFENKLEKLDDAIIELINCKAENERLKGKIDNLTKENYFLKKEVNSFKSIVPGLYVKSKKDELGF